MKADVFASSLEFTFRRATIEGKVTLVVLMFVVLMLICWALWGRDR